jgi:GT2 family glycosyltransferase
VPGNESPLEDMTGPSHQPKDQSRMKDYSVFIIIVNWNNYRDTTECIESLLDVRYESKKIMVIDNGSEDDSLEEIKTWAENRGIDFETIHDMSGHVQREGIHFMTIIALTENMGFSGANNVGINFAMSNGADAVLLLNNDTVVTEEFLSKMVQTALTNDDVGIVGGQINYFDNKERVSFSGGHTNFIKGASYHREYDCQGEQESDYVIGCLMLIPSSVVREVGLLDERYFLNEEDVDFSFRVKIAGYKIIVNCDALIYHKISSSIGGLFSMRHQYYFHRNRMLLFSKLIKSPKKYLFYFFQIFIAIPAWVVIQLFRGRTEAVMGGLVGYFDYARGHFGKCKYF